MRTLFLCLVFLGTAAQAAMQKVSGFDVRDKTTRYEILIGKENPILEERKVELYRVDGKSTQKVKDLDLVYVSEDLANDVDAVYANAEGTLQFGRMKRDPRTKNQSRVVVLKLNSDSLDRKTFVFDAPASLE
ncbi:MAG: hypothetical protein ACK5V3_13005 [Bdellovibrionales bacterium]